MVSTHAQSRLEARALIDKTLTHFGKVLSMTLRDELWDVAVDQYGYVTALDAHQLGAAVVELEARSPRQRPRVVRAVQVPGMAVVRATT